MTAYTYVLKQTSHRVGIKTRDIETVCNAVHGCAYFNAVSSNEDHSPAELEKLLSEDSVKIVKHVTAEVRRACADSARELFPKLSDQELSEIGFQECLEYPRQTEVI